jgi:hypothetical protein
MWLSQCTQAVVDMYTKCTLNIEAAFQTQRLSSPSAMTTPATKRLNSLVKYTQAGDSTGGQQDSTIQFLHVYSDINVQGLEKIHEIRFECELPHALDGSIARWPLSNPDIVLSSQRMTMIQSALVGPAPPNLPLRWKKNTENEMPYLPLTSKNILAKAISAHRNVTKQTKQHIAELYIAQTLAGDTLNHATFDARLPERKIPAQLIFNCIFPPHTRSPGVARFAEYLHLYIMRPYTLVQENSKSRASATFLSDQTKEGMINHPIVHIHPRPNLAILFSTPSSNLAAAPSRCPPLDLSGPQKWIFVQQQSPAQPFDNLSDVNVLICVLSLVHELWHSTSVTLTAANKVTWAERVFEFYKSDWLQSRSRPFIVMTSLGVFRFSRDGLLVEVVSSPSDLLLD